MNISFIIATFNGSLYIQETIHSLTSQMKTNDEIIVVDDASTDDTINKVRLLNHVQLKIVPLANNIGAAGARNEGLKLALGDYVVFIDSDDLWLQGVRDLVDEVLKSHPDTDILSGNVEHFFSPEIKDEIKNQYKLPPVMKANQGAALVARRSLLLKSDGFNPVFRERGEWIDLMSRMNVFEPKKIEWDTIFFRRRIHNTNSSHRYKDLTSYLPALKENILRKRLKIKG